MTTFFGGGSVLTMDRARPRAEALAVGNDGRILTLGTPDDVRAAAGPGAREVDLDGGALMPAFIDAHHHFCLAAFDRRVPRLELPPGSGIADVLAAVERAATELPGESWVRIQGYDVTKLRERRAPRREELDDAAGGRPVLLIAFSFHDGVLSSRGLELMGWDRATPDPANGVLLRDRRGELTGEISEAAFFLAEARSRDSLLERAEDAWLAECEAHGRALLAAGIARVGDAAVPPVFEPLYERAATEGRLPLIVHRMPVAAASMIEPRLDAEPTGSGPADAPVGPAKLFLDGAERCAICMSGRELGAVFATTLGRSIGGGGLAALRASTRFGTPRLGRDHLFHTGMRFWEADALAAAVARAGEGGLQVAQHGVGNEAVRDAVRALERSGALLAHAPGAPRIEHLVLCDRAWMPRIAATGAIAVVQPHWIWDLGDQFAEIATPRSIAVEGLRSLRDAGVPLAGSSDYPVSGFDVLAAVRAAVTRRAIGGSLLAPEESIGVEEALRAYTAGAAAALGVEAEAGALAPGRRADLVVLDRDPTTADPDQLDRVAVRATWVGGEERFSAD